MRIAYLTSPDMVPGAPGVREDLFELELQLGALVPACRARGLALELRVWDDPSLVWSVENGLVDAVVIGTPWDYQDRAEVFHGVLQALGAHVPVLNPPPVIRWNSHKSYLAELERAGVPVVPTVWVDTVDAAAVERARRELGPGRLVAKQVVGACAVGQVLLEPDAPLPAPDLRPRGAAMVQPFLPAIETEGELSLVYCGGALSHALRKCPRPGDYRVQSVYGGREQPHAPTAAERAVAQAVLDAVPGVSPEELLLARVDLVRDTAGALRLMELELIEPYLYPEQGPALGERFAAALARILGR